MSTRRSAARYPPTRPSGLVFARLSVNTASPHRHSILAAPKSRIP